MALGSFAVTKDPRLADPDKEVAFQQWYTEHAQRLGMSMSPDDPAHHYDFRQAYLEGYEPDENGTWDYRASEAFARTAGTKNVTQTRVKGAPGDVTGMRRSDIAPTGTETATPPAPVVVATLTAAQRQDALDRLDHIQKRLGDYTEAIDSYMKGYITPDEAKGYRAVAKSGDDYARMMASHGRDFKKGVALGETVQSIMGMSFLPGFAQAAMTGVSESALGAAQLGLQGALGPHGATLTPAVESMVARTKAEFDSRVLGLPTNPIERAGYDSTFPWVSRLLGDIGAWTAVTAVTGGLSAEAGVPRMLATARGAKGLATFNVLGGLGGAVVGAALAPDDAKGRGAVEGAFVGLGGAALASTFLAGRPIGTPARLLKIQTMAETLGAEGVGGALRVAPRLTFGRMAMSGIEGAGYTALTAIGQGQPIDKAIGAGVEQGLSFAGYDTAFIGLGRMAQWLPIHARIAETWAKTAESLKLPARMAGMLGDTANAGLQAAPGATIGGLIGGPIGAAIGGATSAKKALELQTELATTAARLRSTGMLSEETVGKLLTGNWNALTADEAELVTKSLTKDVVSRATADVTDPVLKYAINESMGSAAILDNTEFRAITMERGRVTQAVTAMRAQGILEIDPQMIQASRRLAELAERRSQILLDEVNAHNIGRSPSTHTGVMGRASEKVANAQMRELIESAGENPSFAVTAEVAGARGKTTVVKSVIPRLDPNAGSALERLHASIRAAAGETGVVRGATEGAPTRIVFRSNSTLLRDLADAHLESAGIDAMLSPEGARALDRIVANPRHLAPRATEMLTASGRKLLTAAPIDAEIVGRAVAPAGTKQLKAPGIPFDFGESGMAAGPAMRALAGGAVGGAIGARDQEHPVRGALMGALTGAALVGGGEAVLREAAGMRRTVAEIRNNIDRTLATQRAELASHIELRKSAIPYRGNERRVARGGLRLDIEPTIDLAEKQLARFGVDNPRARGSFERAYKGYWDEIASVLKRRKLDPADVDLLFLESPRLNALNDRLAAMESKFAAFAKPVANPNEGYIFTPAGFGPMKGGGQMPFFTVNRSMPDGAGRAGSKVSEEVIRRNGLDPYWQRGERGAARAGILGPLGAGAVGALVAPAIAQRLGMLDEEDSTLTASAVGFLAAAGLGYKLLARDGLRLTDDAMRVAKFIQPTVEGAIAPAEATRLVGKTGNEFRTTIGGSQVSGRRLYWLLPQQQQIEHTVSNMTAWPQRTTMRKGGRTITMDMAERRTAFERDLKRFAPFTATDGDWNRVTDAFTASTKALGYTPAESMRLYKGWLGWMTTPLEQRARTDIGALSLDRLGRDAQNPFATAAGMQELRARAVGADTLTGPSMPLPRNYRRATNSLNKQGTPAAGRIRAIVDDIESNTPARVEGAADTITPFLPSVAPTVRFYRYADRLIASGNVAVGQEIHKVTSGIFQATELARVADDKDREVLATIFHGIVTPDDMNLVGRAVQDSAFRESIKGTNTRIYEAAIGVRKFAKQKADELGLPELERLDDYLPWVYNFRTKRELAELAKKGITPSDINYPIDAPVPRQVFFNHLESRTADAPLGKLLSPYESLLIYSHGANRKVYIDQLLANFGPETFQRIRVSQPFVAHDLGRWLLDVVGVPGPGAMRVQQRVESIGLALEKYPMFQRPGLAQEINDRYFLSPGGANNLSRLATGYAYTSKIAWNLVSMMTNMSQQIINGGTEYGLLNVLTSSLIGAGVAGGERAPVLAPIFDATVPHAAAYRKLLTEGGILTETSQRHFDTLALYEANMGTNRAHLALTGGVAGAVAGGTATALLNSDRSNDDKLSVAAGALAGASIATVGAAKSAIMRRALMRVRDVGTFGFNLVETWNRSTIGIAGIREARATERALASPAYAATRRAQEVVEGVFTGALGGAAVGNLLGGAGSIVPGAALGALAAAGAAPLGQSRTARTAGKLETIRAASPVFENRVVREQAKDGLRPHTDDEINTLYAQMQTDITQFRIAKEGRGYFLNTPHGQALGALQSYTLNQAEYVGGLLQSFAETANRAIRGEPAKIDFRAFRFASYLMAVGSVYGALIGGSRDSESDPDYWVSRLGFGVMPMLQFNDITKKWEVKPATDILGGPLVSDITRTANSYLKLMQDEDANASFIDTSDKLVESLFPGVRNVIKMQNNVNGAATLKHLQEGAQESMGGPGMQGRPPGR